jgi:hypothetical protein
LKNRGNYPKSHSERSEESSWNSQYGLIYAHSGKILRCAQDEARVYGIFIFSVMYKSTNLHTISTRFPIVGINRR